MLEVSSLTYRYLAKKKSILFDDFFAHLVRSELGDESGGVEVWSEWLEGHEERMMYAEITTDTETIVMSTRTVLIGRGRWSRPTIWQLMLAPQQYHHHHHHHITITNTRKYQVLPRNYRPASLNTPQFGLLSVCGVEWGLCLNQTFGKRKIQHVVMFGFVFIQYT